MHVTLENDSCFSDNFSQQFISMRTAADRKLLWLRFTIRNESTKKETIL